MWPSKTKVCKVNESCSIADDDDDGVCLYAWTHVDGRGHNRQRWKMSKCYYTWTYNNSFSWFTSETLTFS